jgi:COP9 signalosome complex subunit 1
MQHCKRSMIIGLHQAVEANLALCTPLLHLANANYAKATHYFLQPMSAAALVPWNRTIVPVAYIAVYATLCALATLGRSELDARVFESERLAGDGDGVGELLNAWMASNFRAVLGLLEKYSVSVQFIHSILTITSLGQARYLPHPLLGPHIGNLTALIRSRAVVLYFRPFATIRLERMSTAFGWTVEDTEREVVSLIQRGIGHPRSRRHSTARTKFYGRALRTTARSCMHMR